MDGRSHVVHKASAPVGIGHAFAAVITLLILAATAFSAEAASRVALVIGMSKYQNVGTLSNTVNDANAIAEKLQGLGFEVSRSIDQPLAELVKTVSAFSFKAETSDIAMVYYAGHGVEVNGENYLIPVDAKVTKPSDIGGQAITLKQLRTAVENARKLRIVILDSCRNNPFSDWPVQEVAKVSTEDFDSDTTRSLSKNGLIAACGQTKAH